MKEKTIKIKNKGVTAAVKEFPINFVSHELKLKGKVLFPRDSCINSAIPGAVLCHGFGASHRAMETSARIMASQGVATLIFDFRGHGSSEGAVDDKLVDDVVAAWNTLKQFPGVDEKRMGLIGHSLGAMSAIMAAERVDSPQALIALACPSQVDPELNTDMPVNFGQWGRTNNIMEYPRQGAFPWLKGIAALGSRVLMYLFGYRVRVDLKKFFQFATQVQMTEVLRKLENCSKLFVFCEGDTITPYNKSVLVYQEACEPKAKLLAKGGFHTTPLLPGHVRSQWTSWAVRTLTGQGDVIEESHLIL